MRCQDTYADVGAIAAVDLTTRPWLDAVTDAGWLAAVTPALLPQSCGRAGQSSIEDATTCSTGKACVVGGVGAGTIVAPSDLEDRFRRLGSSWAAPTAQERPAARIAPYGAAVNAADF